MKNDSKAGNFLSAVKKYNEEERAKIISEIESKKSEAVKSAQAKGKADADRYVKKNLSAKKSEITGEFAVKNLEAQGKLFKKRDDMVKEIFKRASNKLEDFTNSPQYKDKLISYAKEISETFKDIISPVTVVLFTSKKTTLDMKTILRLYSPRILKLKVILKSA